MANTVTILSYANTFGDWIVTTNALARENNDFAANNYIKPSGTLYLNDSNLGLQVANVAVIAGQLQVQGIGSSAYIQNNLRVDTQVYFTNTTLGLTNTGQMNVGGIILAKATGTGIAVSNNATIGGTITITGQSNLNGVTYVNNDLYVSGNTNISNTVQITGTTSVSNNLIVTGNTNSNNVIVINNTISNVVQSNTVNTIILLVENEYANNIYANTVTVNNTLNVVGTASFSSINAISSMSTPSMNVVSLIDANNASVYVNNLLTNGQLTIGGNFVINGSTVYNSNVFTINAGSSIGLLSEFDINRGSSGANASIRWNETSKYWDVKNVSSEIYYQLTTSDPTDPIVKFAQAAFNKANTGSSTFNGTTGQAIESNGVLTFASTNGVTITGSSNTITINTPQDVRTSSSPTFNALTLTNALGINQGGTGASSASQALTNLLPTGTTSGYVLTTGGPGSFYWAAGGGGGGGATPGTTIQSSRLSYTGDGSNTAFTTPTYIPGNSQLRVYIDGVRQFSSAYTETSNTLVTLGTAAPSGSSILLEVDGYVINPYYANNIAYTVNSNISGTANTIQLAIDGLTSKVVTNYALQTFAQAAYNQANTATTQTIPISQGGTGATSATQALTNLLPTGTTAGYVLTTGGAGSFYWAAASGGGGATPGTTINTTRIYPTVNAAQTLYTTPTYTPGTGQLRVYINGVRQFGSEYTETSNTSVTLGTGATAGDVILLEVDGYINNPYYANTIAFTVNSNISSTANTIQLALDGLVSKLVTYYANTSSSYSNPTWLPSVSLANLANTANALTTTASYQVGSLGVGTAASGTTGEIRATGAVSAGYSDDRLKTKLGNIENALDKVLNLNGFYYQANETAQQLGYTTEKQVGLSAQQVLVSLPEVVVSAPISNEYLTIQYERLIPLLVEAIKEQQKQIEELKGSIK